MRRFALLLLPMALLGCGSGGGTFTTPTAPTPKTCAPIKVGPIWASDPVTGAAIVPMSVDADGTPHYTFAAGQQVQFHAPVTGGC